MKTRFAPSPTGFLHIGVLRTALFNYLIARKNNGKFILRFEDTDKERSKKIYEEDIAKTLDWLNIEYDEKIYRQSERGEIYEKYLKKLITENKAYYCFCTKEELDKKREIQIQNKKIQRYDGKCSSLKDEEIEERIKRGDSYVIRLRVPNEKIEINDLIRGRVIFDTNLIGDIVIAKSFKEPLYNFTVVIDDFEMDITHIIRGEDILSSTPKQIILYRYLGAKIPFFGHLPMILAPDKSKLSKRHGATAVSDYIKEGYLKEAIINFLAFLGWGPGDEREIFSIGELIKEFDIKNINKSGAVFNIDKLNYLNGYYIRNKDTNEITELCIPYLVESNFITPIFENKENIENLTGIMGRKIETNFIINKTEEKINFKKLEDIISLYKERMKKLSEVTDLTNYFFEKELNYDKELLKWKNINLKEIESILQNLVNLINSIDIWEIKNIEKVVMSYAESYKNGGRGSVLWPLRVSLTGKKSSAGPIEITSVLGKEKTVKRLNDAINKINTN